jgi:hypothetical protein
LGQAENAGLFLLGNRESELALETRSQLHRPSTHCNRNEGGSQMKYTLFFGYAKKMADEGADARYAIPAHRKEGLTVAETEDFVAKQLRELSAFDLVQATNVQRMLRFFRHDNALVTDNRMFVRVPEPTVATARTRIHAVAPAT